MIPSVFEARMYLRYDLDIVDRWIDIMMFVLRRWNEWLSLDHQQPWLQHHYDDKSGNNSNGYDCSRQQAQSSLEKIQNDKIMNITKKTISLTLNEFNLMSFQIATCLEARLLQLPQQLPPITITKDISSTTATATATATDQRRIICPVTISIACFLYSIPCGMVLSSLSQTGTFDETQIGCPIFSRIKAQY